MIRPQPALVMYDCTARVIRNEPRKCTFITASQSSTVNLNSRLSRMMPALSTSTVGSPSSSLTLDRGLHARFVADVDADGDRPAAGLLDVLDDRFTRRLVQVDDGDREAVCGKPPGDAGSDAAGRAGDDGGGGSGHQFALVSK